MAGSEKAKARIGELLAKEMDRKQFLKYLAVAALALTGITAMISVFMRANARPAQSGTPIINYGFKSK